MSEVEFKLEEGKLAWPIWIMATLARQGALIKRVMRDEVLELKFIIKV